MIRIFISFFLIQVLESKYANAMQKKENMDNYQVTSRRGFGIFKSAEPDFFARI
jgi:hypothetical protein